jgi:hypothetical protein
MQIVSIPHCACDHQCAAPHASSPWRMPSLCVTRGSEATLLEELHGFLFCMTGIITPLFAACFYSGIFLAFVDCGIERQLRFGEPPARPWRAFLHT